MLTYAQMYSLKPAGYGDKIQGFWNKKKNKDFLGDKFITVASDGILVSDNHLLLSRVKKMIPYTNQMNIECKL